MARHVTECTKPKSLQMWETEKQQQKNELNSIEQ